MSQALWGGRRIFVSLLILMFQSYILYSSTFEAQENVPLTVFQLIARSDLVVHGRILDGEHRYAVLEVLQTFRGESPASRLRIDFRDLNFELRGQEMVTFDVGEEYILMLERPNWRKPKEKNRDIFALFHGRRGRILLPAEGSGLQVEAVQGLAGLVRSTPEDQAAGLRSMVASGNPVQREWALEEIARLRAAGVEDLPALARLLQDQNPKVRVASLEIIGGVMRLPSAGEADDAEKRVVLEICRERARNDSETPVRVAAVRVLGSWMNRADVAGDLKAISTGDGSQAVRYEALRILYTWGMTGSGQRR